MIKCCLCGKEFPEFQANNPQGAAWKKDGKIELLDDFGPSDRCCDSCNHNYVIPGRLYRMKLAKSLNSKNLPN